MSRADLERIWRAGVEACLPARVLPAQLPKPPQGRTIALAIGKAAAGMSETLEAHWDGPLEGLAVAPHGTSASLARIALAHAAHPLPDQASVVAAERLLALAGSAGPDDLVLVLLSGGASALACAPGEGLSLAAKRRVSEALLRSGASIVEINRVRRRLSRIKGGRLAAAAVPARLVTLAISDVPCNSPREIGSGPTVADLTTEAEARAVLGRYDIEAPAAGWSESVFDVAGEFRVIASGSTAMEAAAEQAAQLGYAALLVGEYAGEVRDAAQRHAQLAREAGRRVALISGGELTVAVSGSGKGGPNQEFALFSAIALAGTEIAGLAADTDGRDGCGGAGGAFFDGSTIARSSRLAAEEALSANDSGGFFAALGDTFVTGPTGTNVSDLRILLTAS